MKKTWLFLIIPALLLTGSGSVFSQEKKVAGTGLEQTFYMGEIKAVSVDSPSRVVVGNPAVADVISVSAQEIMVAGKGAGATNLIWWDDFGEHHLRLRVFTEDMGEIKSRIDGLIKELNLPKVFTRTADSEGKVLLLGSVKSNEEMDRIKTALGLLFARTTNLIQIEEEKAIIELDVEVLEVNKDATKTLGMNWLDSTTGAIALTEPSRFPTRLAGVPDSLIRVTEWTHTSLGATLNLLVQEGKARILSRPKLACQSGKEAELLVGGEKPIMTTQSGDSSDSTSVEYKEYGIKLKMAPVLTSEEKIKLALNVEVSDVGAVETLGSATQTTARAYPLIKRSTATQLYLNDGQTLAISGLIKQKTEEDLQKLPWLGDIPVLGMFFRSRSTKQGGGSGERGDTELVIMITPVVIKDKVENKQAAEEAKPAAKKKAAVSKDKKETVKAAADTEDEEETDIVQETAPAKPKKVEPAKAVKAQKPAVKQQKPAEKKSTAAKPATTAVKKTEEKTVRAKEKKEVKPQKKAAASNKQKPAEKKSPAAASVPEERSTRASDVQGIPAKEETRAPAAEKTIDPETAYVRGVAEYLKNNIFYPWAAKQAELQGTVILDLHLVNTGDLVEARINSSSGYSVLDENALRIAKQITPYPSFPRGISDPDLWVQIPIVYNLKE
jgi:pilus assembly protein CpaC